MLELLLEFYEVKRSQRHLLAAFENKRLGGHPVRKRINIKKFISRSLSMEPCPLTKKLLSTLPYFCINKENGCNEISNEEDLLVHEKICQFRMIFCPFLKCTAKQIYLNYFKTHATILDRFNTWPGYNIRHSIQREAIYTKNKISVQVL